MSMFGAINRFISRLDSDGPSSSGPSRGACGFQVLRNKNDEVPLEPWFDFVIGINGRQIDNPDPHLFSQEVRNCAGSAVNLTVWNAKGQKVRDIHLSIPTPSPTLGVTLQWTPLITTTDVWHILEVIPDSPADNAGLLPYGDYIVGTPEGVLRGESGLPELVEDYLQRPLRLWVYNHEYAVTRLVTITPSRSWGGEGALGCVLGFGALHQLPPALNEPPAAPGDTLFETARFSNEEGRPTRDPSLGPVPSFVSPASYSSPTLLTPATMTSPPPLAAPRTVPAAKRGRKSPSKAFDQMWEESAEKSKEEDFTSKAKATPPPPPPKAAGGAPTLEVPQQVERTETRSPDPILDDDDVE